MALVVTASGTTAALLTAGRADGSCTTNGTTTVTDASCVAADIGRVVTGTDMPTGAYITAVNPGVSFTLNAAATGSHSGLTLTIGPEQTLNSGTTTPLASGTSGLQTPGAPTVYACEVDFSALASGEIVFWRVYLTTLAGGTERLWMPSRTFIGGQDADKIRQSAPFPASVECRATLLQLNGSGRTFPWKLYAPE